MNPTIIYRFTCTKTRRGGSMCRNTFDVVSDTRGAAWDVALARGWESLGDDDWHCDSCSCVMTLCPVCKETRFRYGVDGCCSAFCAARKEAAIIDDESESIIAALKRGLD